METISHNETTTDYFVLMTDWRKRLDEYFLSAIQVRREEILP